MPFARILACLFLLSSLLPFAFATAELFVSSFRLVNTETSKAHRTLTQFDVICATYPWTIIAIVSPSSRKPRSVTFTSPFNHTEYFAPYALSGDTRKQGFKPVNLSPGPHTLSAYVDGYHQYVNRLDFLYHPSLPRRGPLQSELTPTPSDNANGLHIPLSKCGRNSPPRLAIEYIAQTSYNPDCVEALLSVDWCSGKNSVRMRTLRFEQYISPNRTTSVRTVVLSQRIYDNVQSGALVFNFKKCEAMLFYYEACVRSRGNHVKCVTSPLKYMPPKALSEPHLGIRPPIEIQLAPGDTVKIRTVTSKWNKDGLSKRSSDRHGLGYALQGVVELRNGRKSTTPWRIAAATEITMMNVSSDDDGAVSFLRYARPWCRDNIASWRQRYNTRLVVREDVKSLVRQDSSLPSFSTSQFPPTSFGELITFYVNATNTGGGKRKDGSSTQLHYQWYVLPDDHMIHERREAEPIPGATASGLQIDPTKCENSSRCSGLGGIGLQLYYVDVCNTYGCSRSTPIRPVVMPPRNVSSSKVLEAA